MHNEVSSLFNTRKRTRFRAKRLSYNLNLKNLSYIILHQISFHLLYLFKRLQMTLESCHSNSFFERGVQCFFWLWIEAIKWSSIVALKSRGFHSQLMVENGTHSFSYYYVREKLDKSLSAKLFFDPLNYIMKKKLSVLSLNWHAKKDKKMSPWKV